MAEAIITFFAELFGYIFIELIWSVLFFYIGAVLRYLFFTLLKVIVFDFKSIPLKNNYFTRKNNEKNSYIGLLVIILIVVVAFF